MVGSAHVFLGIGSDASTLGAVTPPALGVHYGLASVDAAKHFPERAGVPLHRQQG